MEIQGQIIVQWRQLCSLTETFFFTYLIHFKTALQNHVFNQVLLLLEKHSSKEDYLIFYGLNLFKITYKPAKEMIAN